MSVPVLAVGLCGVGAGALAGARPASAGIVFCPTCVHSAQRVPGHPLFSLHQGPWGLRLSQRQ